MKEDRPILHARQGRDAPAIPFIRQLGIDLVRDDDQIPLAGHPRQRLHVRPVQRAAGRVGREVQHHGPRAGRQPLLEPLGCQPEPVLEGGRHRHRLGPGQRDHGPVRHVARLVIGDLHAGLGHGPNRQIQPLAHPDGHQNLGVRVVGHPERALHVGRDRPPQLERAPVGGVAGGPVIEGKDRSLANLPRRDEVGLADAEADHVLPRADDLEEVADSGPRQVANEGGDAVTARRRVVHGLRGPASARPSPCRSSG